MPHVEAIIKRWIAWAFVPSNRRYPFNSYAIKHEVEEECQLWDISERDIRHAMTDAGFKAARDPHYFYVADSPSRKRYYHDTQRTFSGSVPHPLFRLDPTTEFNRLSLAEQQRLLAWIAEHLRPTKRRTIPAFLPCEDCCGTSSERQSAAFRGAMLAAGYQPLNPHSFYWRFRAMARRR